MFSTSEKLPGTFFDLAKNERRWERVKAEGNRGDSVNWLRVLTSP